ncbi:NAD(P)-dependent oxidoreductase [candidate division GN15 bacterium]|uniref:NAD(P)-dependent oxidoreductase n=1 Tax=candidate division GN15 bacterium TaxID=2072418 RepID=A0A855X4K8_9BACT|nr:MAG: NAD(P)-dependent oxidoreductase [candidate division GN15 bacterium]
MTVGFIGLGNLGRAMAARLAAQGAELVVWNRTAQKADAFVSEHRQSGKVSRVGSPREVADRTQFVFLNLFDSPAVQQVLNGPEGLLSGSCRGKTIVDTTTNHFRTVLSFHESVAAAGGVYLEAPVLGSVVPASQGALTMLVSGQRDAFDRMKPYLDVLAKTIFYLEQPAMATKMKLINNLVLGSFMGAIAESVTLAEESGFSREKTLEILASGAGNSMVLNAKRQKLVDNDFSPHFSVAAIHKDLRYLSEMIHTFSARGVIGEAAEKLFEKAEQQGLGEKDLSAIIESIRKQR